MTLRYIALAGPTASGKTAAALAIAQQYPVEIISVDSALVYRGMTIGTAKPSAQELAAVPHHLINIRDPLNAYSAAEFVSDAHRLIVDITARGKLPVLVGGTMMYFKALFDGLDDMPKADPAVRAALAVPRWHVLGASWGGTVALEYAARRPAALAGLVLQSPLVSTAVWLADARALKEAMPPAVRDLLDRCDSAGAAPKADCDAATAAFYARHVRMYPPPPEIAAYRDALPRSFSAGIYNAMWGRAEFTATGSLKDYDGRPLLALIDGKRTLFVAGEFDEARPATVAGFARAVPGRAGFEMVPDAAHSVMNDNPVAYVALLRRWLATQD